MTQHPARLLLCEIYLYQDNIEKAWETIRPLLPYGEIEANTNRGLTVSISTGARYWDQAIAGITDWEALYSEWMWFIDFDGSKGQTNNLQRWTDNVNGGIYALKPSRKAIEGWDTMKMCLWQYQRDGWFFSPHYDRGQMNRVSDGNGYPVVGHIGDMYRGEGGSYYVSQKDTIIFKYLIKEWGVKRSTSQNDAHSQNDPVFWLYRTGTFYQIACEIINRIGMHTLAFACINGADALETTHHRIGGYPFLLDENSNESISVQIDRLILAESALEGAFEGVRYFDLLRYSSRPEYKSWLGDIVSQKYPEERRAAVKQRLSNPDYWYFPYYYKNVEINPNLHQKPGY
jgi:hypothetical protein